MGRTQTADSGARGPTFTPGRYCTRENVSTKGHMAPFCMRPLDKGAGGAERLPGGGTLLEGTGPTPLRQQAGGLRERMGNFSCWLGSCDAGHEEGFVCHSLLWSSSPTFCSAPAGRADPGLSKPSQTEACETPQLPRQGSGMLVNLDGEIERLDSH